ncbi:UNVERIFIED_ORG: hypothetical protein FHR35_001530 [Microbispora rosea subsp. rosea]
MKAKADAILTGFRNNPGAGTGSARAPRTAVDEMGVPMTTGLSNGAPYTLQTLQGSGTALTLSTPNSSGVDRVRYAWGSGSGGTSALRGVASDRCLDVPGSPRTNGTQVTIYDCNGGANQQWKTT